MGGKQTLTLWPFQILEPLGRMQMERQHRAWQTKKKAAEEEEQAEAALRLEGHESAPCCEARGGRSPAYRFKLAVRHPTKMTRRPNVCNGSKAVMAAMAGKPNLRNSSLTPYHGTELIKSRHITGDPSCRTMPTARPTVITTLAPGALSGRQLRPRFTASQDA